jgi:hypothetical protein
MTHQPRELESGTDETLHAYTRLKIGGVANENINYSAQKPRKAWTCSTYSSTAHISGNGNAKGRKRERLRKKKL